MKRAVWILLIISLLLVAGCSIDLSGPTHKPADPIYIFDTPTSADAAATTPVPWASAKLSGHLVYVEIPRKIVQLDLATGRQKVLFTAPNNAFVSSAQVSPDDKWIVMAYAPPADPSVQSVNTDLYVMPAAGSSAPQALLQRATPQESFFNPVWSADGQYIYYSHLIPDPTASRKYTNYKYDLERMAYPNGQPQKLADDAFWPRLSRDGSKLAFVSFVPSTNSNDLYLAQPDGRQAKLVMPAGAFSAVDAPLFSPEGSMLVFSAVGGTQQPGLSWFDQLLGVQIAEAHNVPSDWWNVPADGGTPHRLTSINGTGMYADYAPDGQHIAFASLTGLYVMQPDGSHLMQLVNAGLGPAVSWTP